MVELVAIVEGPTEQTFVRDILAGHLILRGVSVWPILSGKSRRHGGIRSWSGAREDILRILKSNRHCTSMFDFYGMPSDWPGRAAAAQMPIGDRASYVETAILDDLQRALSDLSRPAKFIPYIQLHEFEALLFADPTILAEATAAICGRKWHALGRSFQRIVDDAGAPEAIDDGHDTCPSRRIAKLVTGYRKAVIGPIVAKRIGLSTLRAKCRHFGAWLDKLEQLDNSENSA